MRKLLVFVLILGFAIAAPIQYFKVKGIRGAVVPRADVDSVVAYILVRGGSAYDPQGKEGLTDLLTTMLTKGTEKYDAIQFAEKVETMGSTINAYTGSEAMYVNAWALKDYFEPTFSLMADALLHPAFSEKQLQKEKNRLISSLAQKWDQPSYLASEIFRSRVLEGTPFGREETPETVKRITRDDLIKFHRKYFTKKNIFIVFAGNITLLQAKNAIKKYLAGMEKGRKISALPVKKSTTNTEVYIVDKESSPQTQIRIGYVAPGMKIKNRVAREVANYILGGGGFSSRMMKKIRAIEGLTYGIYSYFTPFAKGGYFVVSTFTKNDTVGKTIKLALEEIKKFREKGATEEELKKAKSYYLGSYALKLETPMDFAYRILTAELYGLGKKYIYWEKNEVPALTLRDVNLAARKYFHEKPVVIVCVGPVKKLKPQLEQFGKVRVIKPPKFK